MSHLHCTHCGQDIKLGQAQLTRREKAKYDWGGANDPVNIIRAQCVKAAAQYYDVEGWTDYWEPTLSISENIDTMRRVGAGGQRRRIPEEYR